MGGVPRLVIDSGVEGRILGIVGHRADVTYAAVLGACAAGLPYVPVGPSLPVDRQPGIIQRAGVRHLVTDRPVDTRVRECAPLRIASPEDDPAWRRLEPLEQPRAVPPGSVAYVMFTSGTTGKPKAVQVSAGNVQHFLGVMRDRFPIHADDRVSQFYELNFDLSVFDIFTTLGAGASLHVVPEAQRMAPGSSFATRH